MMAGGSVRAGEVQKFDALAARWWDASGPMKPLHMMNPVRAGWVLERMRRRFGRVEGVRVLDVGCGAGLLSEALAKAGCVVTGVDAAGEVVEEAGSLPQIPVLANRYWKPRGKQPEEEGEEVSTYSDKGD